MEKARKLFQEKVNQTKLFFTKEKQEADKLSYNQFDGMMDKLKKILAKCNGDNKEEIDEDDQWTDDVEIAIVEHGGWRRFDADIKKFKQKREMARFQDEFIPSDGYDDDDNSHNKNKKRNKPVESEMLQPPKKKRKQNLDNGISEEEVCLMVLFTFTCCQRNFPRFCVVFDERKDAFMANFHDSCMNVFGFLLVNGFLRSLIYNMSLRRTKMLPIVMKMLSVVSRMLPVVTNVVGLML